VKRLLSMLISRSGPWWDLRVSEGDPPEERTYMFVLPALLSIIKRKLSHTEVKDETPLDP
jgi:hypothetical protein